MIGKNVLLNNVMEQIVIEQVDFLYSINQLNCCPCEKCKFDIVAIVLNGMPPKYVVTNIGGFYAKFESLKNQCSADISRLATIAAERVTMLPQHEVR